MGVVVGAVGGCWLTTAAPAVTSAAASTVAVDDGFADWLVLASAAGGGGCGCRSVGLAGVADSRSSTLSCLLVSLSPSALIASLSPSALTASLSPSALTASLSPSALMAFSARSKARVSLASMTMSTVGDVSAGASTL